MLVLKTYTSFPPELSELTKQQSHKEQQATATGKWRASGQDI